MYKNNLFSEVEDLKFDTVDSTINILGTEYNIYYKNYDDVQEFKDGAAGFCDMYTKEIYICLLESYPDYKSMTEKHKISYYKAILRHEILHAFCFECGLDNETHTSQTWATDEEIIDWFSIMSPKIYKVYGKLDILD